MDAMVNRRPWDESPEVAALRRQARELLAEADRIVEEEHELRSLREQDGGIPAELKFIHRGCPEHGRLRMVS